MDQRHNEKMLQCEIADKNIEALCRCRMSQKRHIIAIWIILGAAWIITGFLPWIASDQKILFAIMGATVAFNLARMYRYYHGLSCGISSILLEILLATGLVWATGGIESPFSALFLVIIAGAGPVYKARGMLATGTLSGLFYGAIYYLDSAPRLAVPEQRLGIIVLMFILCYTYAVSVIYRELSRSRRESEDLAENARKLSQLYEEAEVRNREISALQNTVRVVAQTLNLSDVFAFVSRAIVETLGFNSSMVCIVDHGQGEIRAVEGFNVSPDLISMTQRKLNGSDILADIVRTKKVEVINGWDPRFDHKTFETFVENYGSRIFAPIILRGEVLGVVEIGTPPGKKDIDEHSVELVQSFLDHVAVAIGNAQHFERVERYSKQLETLNHIGSAITSKLDLTEIMNSVVEATGRLMDSEMCVLRLAEGDDLVLGAQSGVPEGRELTERISYREGLSGIVLQSKEPVTVIDMAEDPRIKREGFLSPEDMTLRTYVGTPLMIGGELIGLLGAFIRTGRQITESEKSVFAVIANQASVAIRNALHFREIQQHVNQLKALVSVGSAISSSLELDEIMATIVEVTGTLTNAERCVLRLKDGNNLVLGAYKQASDQPAPPETIPADVGLQGILTSSRELIAISNLQSDPRFTEEASKFIGSDMRSFLGIPLVAHGELMGVLGVFDSKVREFSERETGVFKTIGNQGAAAIANARDFEEIRSQIEQLRALSAVGSAISSSLGLQEMMSAVVETTSQLMDAEICSIRLLDGNELIMGAQKGLNGTTVNQRISSNVGLANILLSTRKPLMIPDLRNDKRLDDYNLVFSDSHLRSFLGAPLIAHGEVLGIIGIYRREVHHFSERNIEVFNAIANQVAVAATNARLYDQVAQARDELEAKVEERTRDLAESNGRIQSILSAISDGIVLIDKDYKITWINEVQAKRFGQVDKLIGKSCHEVFHGSSERCENCAAKCTFESGNLNRGIIKSVGADGEPHYYDQVTSPIRDADGNIIQILEMLRDITEKRRMEEQLAEYTKKLEHMVDERTAELQRKNEELESFVFTVSHDLKAPIVSIQGFSANLAREYAPSLQGDGEFYLQRIRKNTEQLQSLIQELLELSRIGRLPEPWEPVDSKELAEEVGAELQYQIQNHHISLEIEDDMPVVVCQRKRFRQVFVNLIDNAIHYRGSSENPFIRVGARDLGGSWEFSVRDNGVGVAPENQRKIFQIFQRLHKVPDAKDGAGVGLAIVKKIVETHGGLIRVESEGEGLGTTFFFTIPKRADSSMEQAA